MRRLRTLRTVAHFFMAIGALMLVACSSALPPSDPAPRAVRALVVAADRGPAEPRHVADALMQYHLLRSRGLTDAQIQLALPAWAIGGPDGAPVVRARVGGPDLRAGAEVDLAVSSLDPERIGSLLDPGKGPAQIYVFLSGHGDHSGMMLTENGPLIDGSHVAKALERLRAATGEEVAFTVVIEACEPDTFLDALEGEPGAAVLTASQRGRNSYATEFDRESGTWLADEFTTALTELVSTGSPGDASELLARLRAAVRDSEPQLAAEPGLTVAELIPPGL